MASSSRDWVTRLNSEEQAYLKVSEDFFTRPSGRFQKVASKLSRPIDKLFKASPAKLQDGVTKVIHGVLTTVAEGAAGTSSEKALVDELCEKIGLELQPWARIFEADFEILDHLANKKLQKAKNLATVQGA